MVLPDNYETTYTCINGRGTTAKIFVNSDYSKAYKIYRKNFLYEDDKFKTFLTFQNPNFFTPIDTVSLESDRNKYVGYEMNYDTGISLPNLKDQNLVDLINSSKNIYPNLKDLSAYHFLIMDPNVENITFSTEFKFVDTYSFLLLKSYSQELILKRNMIKINDAVMSGLINSSYKKAIVDYLKNSHSKYLEMFINLIQNNLDNADYIYNILSILEEVTKEEELSRVRKIVCNK